MTNFDPTKHKFGMAYSVDGGVIYPTDEYYGEIKHCVSGGIVAYCNTKYLTRAPEHDLIPRADVMELVRGLEVIAEISQDNAPAYQLIQNIDATAIKALTNFKQKYGE